MKGEERKEFLKEYKMSLISGSILTISPSLAGILLWEGPSAGEDRNTF